MTASDEQPAMPISLRAVVDTDEAFLHELYATTRADELSMVPWDIEQKQAFVAMQFRAQHADYSARFPASQHSIVLHDDNPVGRVWVDRRRDEIRLLDIALLPEHQNSAIGTELLERLQSEARLAGVPLRHSVARDNSDAMRFYERLGFAVIEQWDMHDLMEWVPSDGDLSRANA